MTTGELLNHLRMRLTVMGLPALVEPLLISYLADAYESFVSAMEGVPDEETIVIAAEDAEVNFPAYVLKIKSAQTSAGDEIKIINRGDTVDSSIRSQLTELGELKYLLIGTKPTNAKTAPNPSAETTVILDIDRLPKTPLAVAADVPSDVPAHWQMSLVDFAVAQVMVMSPDANVRGQASGMESRFYGAAAEARKQKARVKSKSVRVVQYQG